MDYGTKLDSCCHVAHNDDIGEDCLIAAHNDVFGQRHHRRANIRPNPVARRFRQQRAILAKLRELATESSNDGTAPR